MHISFSADFGSNLSLGWGGVGGGGEVKSNKSKLDFLDSKKKRRHVSESHPQLFSYNVFNFLITSDREYRISE